jgi:hypothetical protein
MEANYNPNYVKTLLTSIYNKNNDSKIVINSNNSNGKPVVSGDDKQQN